MLPLPESNVIYVRNTTRSQPLYKVYNYIALCVGSSYCQPSRFAEVVMIIAINDDTVSLILAV